MHKNIFPSLVLYFFACVAANALTLTGNFSPVAAGSNVDLTAIGKLDWVQWGWQSDYAVNRKASVTPFISNFTLLSVDTNTIGGYWAAYWLTNNSYCSWSDGTPIVSLTNNNTEVMAYSYPTLGGSGFKLTVPADTTTRVLSVFVGTIASGGNFKATLNGQSYSDSQGAGVDGVYTITYAANTAGQTLTVTWTHAALPITSGNVTLKAAALSAPGADNPPFALLTSPATDSTFQAPANITLVASAQDFDGTVTNVTFYADSSEVGQSAAGPYSVTWSNAPLGHHLLTAVATDNDGVSRSSVPADVYVYDASGSETGSVTNPPVTVDLTGEGTADWIHWGLVTNTSVDRKSGVPAQISDFTPLGTAAVQRYTNNYTGFSWTDGTPTLSASGTTTGVFITGLTNGFSLTVPADSNLRTLNIYVGAYAARGHFLAYLSDFSAKPYIDSSVYDTNWASQYAVYSINYRASSPGQQLTVIYRCSELLDEIWGNLTLQAATLQGALPVYIINPMKIGSDFVFSFLTQPNYSYAVQEADSLPPLSWGTTTNLPGTGGMVTVTNHNATGTQRFYRVQTQ